MIREGTIVKWKWGKGSATGTVVEIYTNNVEKTINGNKVKREASQANPAYLIEEEDGQEVLKSKSEVSRVSEA